MITKNTRNYFFLSPLFIILSTQLLKVTLESNFIRTVSGLVTPAGFPLKLTAITILIMCTICDLISKLKTPNVHIISSYIVSFHHVHNTCIINLLMLLNDSLDLDGFALELQLDDILCAHANDISHVRIEYLSSHFSNLHFELNTIVTPQCFLPYHLKLLKTL